MKILSVVWGFSLGGIAKVVATYAKMGESDRLSIKTVVVSQNGKAVNLSDLDGTNHLVISTEGRFDFSWIGSLKEIVGEENPDIIFVHGFNGAVYGFLFGMFSPIKVPMVCSYHGLYSGPTKARQLIAPFYNAAARIIYRYFAKKIITVERYSKDFLIRKGVPSNKIEVVYNGVDESPKIEKITRKDWGIGDEDFVIGCASRLDPEKGIVFLIDAFARLKNELSGSFKLVILGEGTLKKNLEKKVKDLGLTENVIFGGFQSNVPGWLELFDIFALPSLVEFHSIGLLEAMRAGKAIVATNVGGNPESIRNDKEGLIVKPASVNELHEAMKTIYLNKEKKSLYGRSAFNRFLKMFTEERTIENARDVLKDLKS